MTDTPLSNDVLDAAMRAFGDTEIVGGPPSFTKRAMANAIRAALEAARYGEMVKGLERIAEPYKHGHCGGCGKPCEGHTDDCCERNHWEPDDPELVARAILSSIGASQP